MNYEVAILYAKQRMRELGKLPCEYHFEPVNVCCTETDDLNGSFDFLAYNEIYILVNPENYFGFLIIADNSTYNPDNLINSGVPEFTGHIYFNKTADPWSLTGAGPTRGFVEFLRVVIY